MTLAARRRRRVVVESLGSYLPERRVSTSEVISGCKVPLHFPLEWVTGIRSRRVAAPGEGAVTLARAAIDDCLSRSRWTPADFDLLICGSISNNDPGQNYCYEPAAAVRLKAACGFDQATVFDVSNGCAGLWTAIFVAEGMIATGLLERALVVSGEAIFCLTETAQREIADLLDPQVSSLTLGDAAVALALEASDRDDVGFETIGLRTIGGHSRLCIAKPGDQPHGSVVMRTDALRMGATAVDYATADLLQTLSAGQWHPEDFALLIPHQTSETTLLDGFRRVNQALSGDGFFEAQYVVNLAERGNTATTSHWLAVHDAAKAGLVQTGDRLGFSVSGSGLSIGTAIYRFDDWPDRQTSASLPRHVAPAHDAERAALLKPVAAHLAGFGLVHGDEAAGLDDVELCRRAGRQALDAANMSPENVELLIHAGTYKSDFVFEPATAAFVADAIGINATEPPGSIHKTLGFDLMAGPLGVLKACWVADRLIHAGACANALVVAADVENNASQRPDLGVYGLEPAGSAFVIAGEGGGVWFEHIIFRDFPEYVGEFVSFLSNPDGHPKLVVQQTQAYDECLLRCCIATMRDVEKFVGHPIAGFDIVLAPTGWNHTVAKLEREFGLPSGRIVSTETNLVGAGLAAGLMMLQRTGQLQPKTRFLMLAAGAGIQIGCAVMRS